MKWICKLITIFIPIFFSFASAQNTKTVKNSLKSLAQASSFLLAQSDLFLGKKGSCYSSHQEISMASQKLKSWVDQKISQLTEDDFKILKNRIATCETDCSCPIYSLAFENKIDSITDTQKKLLDKKASSLKGSDHIKCAKTNQMTCETALIRALK